MEGVVKLEFEVHAVVHWRARREVDVGWVGYAATVWKEVGYNRHSMFADPLRYRCHLVLSWGRGGRKIDTRDEWGVLTFSLAPSRWGSAGRWGLRWRVG